MNIKLNESQSEALTWKRVSEELQERTQFFNNVINDPPKVAPNDKSDSRVKELAQMDRPALKRVVDESVFQPGRPYKRLKPAPLSDASRYLDPKTAEFLMLVHQEVLYQAGKGGLINPLHFKLTDGVLGITKEGLERCKLFQERPSQRRLIDAWVEKSHMEMSKRVRDHLEAAGFMVQGHKSLLPLCNRLRDGKVMEVGNLVEYLQDVITRTGPLCDSLGDCLKPITEEKVVDWTDELVFNLAKHLTPLYALRETSKLSAEMATFLLLGGTRNLQLKVVARLEGIIGRYNKFSKLEQTITVDSRIPHYYISPHSEPGI